MVEKALIVSAATTFANVSFHTLRRGRAPIGPGPCYEISTDG